MKLYVSYILSPWIRCRWEQKQVSIQSGRDHKTDEVSRCDADFSGEDSCRFAIRWELMWQEVWLKTWFSHNASFTTVHSSLSIPNFLYININKLCQYPFICAAEHYIYIYIYISPIIYPLNLNNFSLFSKLFFKWCSPSLHWTSSSCNLSRMAIWWLILA